MALAIGLISAGCGKKGTGDKVLANVSNKAITTKDFERRIARLPAYYRDIADKNKKRFLDEYVMETIFYEEAVRKGIDRDREVKDILEEAKKKILITKLLKNEVDDKIQISDGEVTQFYEDHKDDFKTPELWRASHILVATEEEARAVQAELAGGASFEELARARSTDATASRGGDVGYFRMGQLVPEFENACLKLKVGETSDIVRTQFGYHIIKLTDRKEPGVETLDRVRRAIEEELRKRKRADQFDLFMAGLKERYNVRVDEDAVGPDGGDADKPAAQ